MAAATSTVNGGGRVPGYGNREAERGLLVRDQVTRARTAAEHRLGPGAIPSGPLNRGVASQRRG